MMRQLIALLCGLCLLCGLAVAEDTPVGGPMPASIVDVLDAAVDAGYRVAALDVALSQGHPWETAAAVLSRQGENTLLLFEQYAPQRADGGYAEALRSTLALPQGEETVFDLRVARWDMPKTGHYGVELTIEARDMAGGQARLRRYVFLRPSGDTYLPYGFSVMEAEQALAGGGMAVRRISTLQGEAMLSQSRHSAMGVPLDMEGMWYLGQAAPGPLEAFYADGLPLDVDVATLANRWLMLPLLGDVPDMAGGQMIPVYSGPGAHYYRASEGKAAVSTNEPFWVLGICGDWAMIRYNVGDRDRFGYIQTALLPAGFEAMPLTFLQRPAKLVRDCQLMEGPGRDNRRLVHLQMKDGWQVTVLGNYDTDGYYVECVREGREPVRGFLDGRYLDI